MSTKWGYVDVHVGLTSQRPQRDFEQCKLGFWSCHLDANGSVVTTLLNIQCIVDRKSDTVIQSLTTTLQDLGSVMSFGSDGAAAFTGWFDSVEFH